MVNKSLHFHGHTPLNFAVQISSERIVRVLLKYGTNASERYPHGDTSVLELAERQHSRDISKLLIQKMVEMEFLNSSIHNDGRKLIENNRAYKRYYDEYREICSQDFQQLKDTKFYGNVSVYRIYMASKKEVCGFARNEELVRAMDMQNYENKCPIYFAKKFHVEVKNERFRNAAASILGSLFKFSDSSHLVNQKILSYLRGEDLTILNINFREEWATVAQPFFRG